eukprot:g23421.t1
MSILQKIQEIEHEMARTQKNKATEYHLGTLKAKLAKLRTQLMAGPKGSSAPGEGFDVMKSGDARVAIVGFPSVGKSTMLTLLTETASEAASYEFTTLTCIPGVLQINDAKIQLLDLPGIIEGASKGKGRGRQVIGVARTADLVLIMVDADKAETQIKLLEWELESVGIRLNKRPADVVLKQKKGGGNSFNATCELTHLSEAIAKKILQEYRIHCVDVLVREDCTVDEFIDVVEGNRKYLRCLYVVNKIDNLTLDQVDRLARLPDTVVCSIRKGWNVPLLKEKIWEYLDLQRVFTKPRGKRPDFTDPLIMRRGATIEHVCHGIHRDMVAKFKYALVWGTSTKHQPQRVGLQHVIEDEDVVQLMTKGGNAV